MGSRRQVSLAKAVDPLVLAVDVGSTASRGDVYEPFLTGERSTGWAADARAVLAGVSASTTGAMLIRGTMEGVAISYARIAAQLPPTIGSSRRLLASGRVAKDLPAFLQILADVLGSTVTPVLMKRSTLRGTALIALEWLAPEWTGSRPPLARCESRSRGTRRTTPTVSGASRRCTTPSWPTPGRRDRRVSRRT